MYNRLAGSELLMQKTSSRAWDPGGIIESINTVITTRMVGGRVRDEGVTSEITNCSLIRAPTY